MKTIKRLQKNPKPILRFSPTAWAKLLLCRDMTDNEVGGFGITKVDDLLFVTDFVLVKQKVTSFSVSFVDDSVADMFEDQVAAGKKPQQFARIWLHTHPGNSPQPSMTDEATFRRVFGTCDWSVMFILAQDSSSYARMHFKTGPGGDIELPVYVDYSHEFEASNFEEWAQQYNTNVTEETFTLSAKEPAEKSKDKADIFDAESPQGSNITSEDLLIEIGLMHPIERQVFMDELALRSELWDEESEMSYEY